MVRASRILFIALWHINNTHVYKDEKLGELSGEDGTGWNSEGQNVKIGYKISLMTMLSFPTFFLQNLLIDSHRLLASFEELAGPPPQGPPVSFYSLNPR